jgi:peptidoglycan hydrolase-like protein with peptidoglycan-binding domain
MSKVENPRKERNMKNALTLSTIGAALAGLVCANAQAGPAMTQIPKPSAAMTSGAVPMILIKAAVYKIGDKGPRVAVVRQRLASLGFGRAYGANASDYDLSLVTAVRAFQTSRGLKSTGLPGPLTIDALNGLGDNVALGGCMAPAANNQRASPGREPVKRGGNTEAAARPAKPEQATVY